MTMVVISIRYTRPTAGYSRMACRDHNVVATETSVSLHLHSFKS